MIPFNIDYEGAVDFEHCQNINEAMQRLSTLTNLLNSVIMVKQKTKQSILEACASYHGEGMHKLSWDNKLVRLLELSGDPSLYNVWQEANTAYVIIKNKQAQVIEDIMALKKIADITPR